MLINGGQLTFSDLEVWKSENFFFYYSITAIMPYRKRRTRKRPYRRRTRKRQRMTRYKRGPILEGFPKRKLVKLRYVQEVSLNPGISSFSVHQFRANSVFDPDFTGVGHQPMGFDEWAALYERYTVYGSKINVMYAPTSTASVAPGYYGVTLYGTAGQLSSTYGNVEAILEGKLTGYTTTMSGSSNSVFLPRSLWRKFSARNFFGKTDPLDDPDIGALVSTNPVNLAYYGVWCGASGGNDPGQMNFKVQIDYIVMFHEPYLLVQS